jgi:hypothetical protein
MRTIVDLTESQVARLARVAARERISRAEAVRRAIDMTYTEENSGETPLAEVRRPALGLWKDRGVDSVAYVDALRDEWDR